jgi:putative phosphoesterase
MKILAFVDLHGNLTTLKKIVQRAKKEDIDLLISAGDMTIFGSKLRNILQKLNKVNKSILIIHGNHEMDKELEKACSRFKNCIFLHKKNYRKNNHIFLGFGGGGFSLVDKEFEKTGKKFEKLIKKDDKVILITHAPPYNTNIDKINKSPCGNKSIRNFIKKTKPDLAISGHLHENAGKEDKIGKTKIINPGYKGKVIVV